MIYKMILHLGGILLVHCSNFHEVYQAQEKAHRSASYYDVLSMRSKNKADQPAASLIDDPF